MFEPRGTFHSITLWTIDHGTSNLHHHHNHKRSCRQQRREQQHQNDTHQQSPPPPPPPPTDVNEPPQPLYERHYYNEPEIPVHPALEFEIQTTEPKEMTTTKRIVSWWSLDTTTTRNLESSPNPSLDTPFLIQPSPPLLYHDGNDEDDNTNGASRHHGPTIGSSLRVGEDPPVTDSIDDSWCCPMMMLGVGGCIGSGVGMALCWKLQAVSMYNYPNFINLYTNLLYIPFCWAYIVPLSTRHGGNQQKNPFQNSNNASSTTSTVQGRQQPPPSQQQQPFLSNSLMVPMMVIGTLDAITATIQTFAAVYVPGPLLVLVPQVAIPISILVRSPRSGGTWATHSIGWSWPTVGAILILIGILIVLVPVWSSERAPDYYCEAIDPDNDCTICKIASTEMQCTGTASSKTHPQHNRSDGILVLPRWLFNASSTDDGPHHSEPLACQWLPYNESTKEKESLEVMWSILLMISSIPMAMSAVYKQRALQSHFSDTTALPHESANSQSTATPLATPAPTVIPSSPVLYMSGWIAVFQLLASLLLTIPVGIMASPSIRPWKIPENLLNGLFCYAGYPVIVNGCHPDTICTSYHATLWMNIGVLCHVVYTISVMVILQASDNCVPLFLALTVTVPLGHLAFALPILPLSSQESLHAFDMIGLSIVVAGLVLYRFTSETSGGWRPRNHLPAAMETDEEESVVSVDGRIKLLSQQIQASIGSLWTQVANQTSYTLLRDETLGPVPNGNV